jgi:tetrahydromethanopterin S-methyltransferase subunit G
VMAENELDQRRKRLEEFQVQARFALSESYDRASKKQLDESGAK